ncbi:MAG: Fic family protein [Polyangia bacterium]
MFTLDARALQFLHESNAIEEIHDIDYTKPENLYPGRGHAWALLDSQARALRRERLELEDICRWQRLLTEEQARYGHAIPARGIGRLRGPEAPFNVRVGNHIAPPWSDVQGLMQKWLSELHKKLEPLNPLVVNAVTAIEILGDFFQRFEAIHPFVDGNGRTGRLIANYLITYCRHPIIIFRSSERQFFYEAHRSKMAMRCFMLGKYEEATFAPDWDLLERIHSVKQDPAHSVEQLNAVMASARYRILERKSRGLENNVYGDEKESIVVDWSELRTARAEWSKAV